MWRVRGLSRISLSYNVLPLFSADASIYVSFSPSYKIAKYKKVTIQMDITYWDRNFGLMVVRDALIGVVLWHKYVTHETIAYYVEGIEWLKSKGFKIYGVVIDGMKGLPQALKPIKVLMCQFHQILTARRHLTKTLI